MRDLVGKVVKWAPIRPGASDAYEAATAVQPRYTWGEVGLLADDYDHVDGVVWSIDTEITARAR